MGQWASWANVCILSQFYFYFVFLVGQGPVWLSILLIPGDFGQGFRAEAGH
jgi:hypothetical protein